MDKKKIIKTQIIVTTIAIILGTIFHFVYGWSGENKIVGIFTPVNESVWEHLKLAFFPMLILAIIQYFYLGKKTHNYIEAKTIGIFTSILFIIVFYYTYTGIIGTNFLILDILTFIISIILGEYVAYKLMNIEEQSNKTTKILSAFIIIVLFTSFIVFTYKAPKANLFKSGSQNNIYTSKTRVKNTKSCEKIKNSHNFIIKIKSIN